MNVPILLGSPPEYTPTPPNISAPEFLFGLFSSRSRARLCLAKAHRSPDDQTIASLKKAAGALKSSLTSRDESNDLRTTYAEILSFLTWHAIQTGATQEAETWLDELARSRLSPEIVLSLRWKLMTRLWNMHILVAYQRQAKTLFADTLVSVTNSGKVLLETLANIYSGIGRLECGLVVKAAHRGVKVLPVIQAVEAIACCPQRFQSAAEVQQFTPGLRPEMLDFCPKMQADSLLAQAQAAEWGSDWTRMNTQAQIAVSVMPEYLPTRFWAIRAAIRSASSDPLSLLHPLPLPQTDEWQRLHLAALLAQTPTYESAEAVLPLLQSPPEIRDPLETDLLIRLVERAVTVDVETDLSTLQRAAALCEAVEGMVGQHSWTERVLAIKAVRIDRDYRVALQRMNKPLVLQQPGMPELQRIASFLDGNPQVGGKRSGMATMAALEDALVAILTVRKVVLKKAHKSLVASVRRDKWSHLIPGLETAAIVLDYAHAVLSSSAILGGEIANDGSLIGATPWMSWLYMRCTLIANSSVTEIPQQTGFRPDERADAWAIESWWFLYGSPAVDLPATVGQSHRTLDAEEERLPPRQSRFLRRLRGRVAASKPLGSPLSLTTMPDWQLGDLCNTLLQQEMDIAASYAEASTGDAKVRLAKWRELYNRVNQSPTLAAAWWRPAVAYRYAAALAHSDPQEAEILWDSLQNGGPKTLEARAQSALLAIQRGDHSTAEQTLRDVPILFPGVLYAKALVAVRCGHELQARQFLELFKTLFGPASRVSCTSPYQIACLRLLAALEERTGNQSQAEQYYLEVLAQAPEDSIAAIRLARIRLKKSYQNVLIGGTWDAADCTSLLKIAHYSHYSLLWVEALHTLYELMSMATDSLIDMHSPKLQTALHFPRGGTAFAQVIAHHLLEQGSVFDAHSLIDTDLPSASATNLWWWRTRWILHTWHRLNYLWDPSGKGHPIASLKECLASLHQFGQKTDTETERWAILLRSAINTLQDGTSITHRNPDWNRLGDWPIATAAQLWAEDEHTRKDAASALQSVLAQGDAGWSQVQHNVLCLLIAHTMNSEAPYLEAYTNLEQALDTVPLSVESVWLATGRIWLRRKNWRDLLDGDMPEAVADLSRPEVRLIIGLAYAGAAADSCARDDVQQARRQVRQAQSTLEPILLSE